MYLTRMKLDTLKRRTLLALSVPSLFHGAVETAFSGERKRNLWRIDKMSENYYLLLLSEDLPDLSDAREQFGADNEQWLSKDYNYLLKRIENGSYWQFRLAANPTYTVVLAGKKRGRVCAHTTIENQKKWFIGQSEKYGFQVEEGGFDVLAQRWYHFSKGASHKKINMLLVTFEGRLKVTDVKLFKEALLHGIGREKAYGAGLMTLMQSRGSENG